MTATAATGTARGATQPRTVLKTPTELAVVERLPEQHGHDRRDHDRQVREHAVQAAARAAPRSSAPPRRAARVAEDQREQREVRRVLDGDRQQRVVRAPRGSCRARPRSATRTRFVCCNDITTVRTIGYHENAPKTSSSGSRKSSVDRPPSRTHVSGERRARAARRSRGAAPFDLDLARSLTAIPSRGGRPFVPAARRPPLSYLPREIAACAVLFACVEQLTGCSRSDPSAPLRTTGSSAW